MRSLKRRLLLAFGTAVSLLWVALIAVAAWSALSTPRDEVAAELRTTARQIMVGMRLLVDLPDRMAVLAEQLQRLENESSPVQAQRMRLQVWRQGRLVYGQHPDFPSDEPSTATASVEAYGDGPGWLAWTEHDAETGLKLRVATASPQSVMVSMTSVAYYVLPLVLSLPVLALITWPLVGYGLRPLTHVADQLSKRSPAALQPLEPSSYQELAPIVVACNRLFERIGEHGAREKTFVSDAAHELKTPLAVVRVNADAMLSASSGERLREARQGLAVGLERAVRTVHQLLAMVRAEGAAPTFEARPEPLDRVLAERLAAAEPSARERDIELVLETSIAGRRRVDPNTLALLVDNVVDNAIKYSPLGGLVRVGYGLRADGAEVLEVEDAGPGLAPEQFERAFDRFWRLPGQDTPGTGLGLSIARQAARRLGAEISLGPASASGGLRVSVVFGPPPSGHAA